MIGNEIADRITKVSKLINWWAQIGLYTCAIILNPFVILPSRITGCIRNDHDKEIHKERFISPDERQESIDKLRLK